MMKPKVWIVTLFPEYFYPLLECGVVGQALRGQRGPCVPVELVQLRDFAKNNYKSVDDYPFGGGPGMILKADCLREALVEGIMRPRGLGGSLEEIKKRLHVIFPSPRGKVWERHHCWELAGQLGKMAMAAENSSEYLADDQGGLDCKDIVFICGRYEGVDERFVEIFVDEEWSLGDFVLSGGEIAVLAMLDSALRLIPGTLGNSAGTVQESFEDSLLEGPQYTRPQIFEGKKVPSIYLSGHHQRIEEFKENERLRVTEFYRPDLYSEYIKNKRPHHQRDNFKAIE